MQPGDVYVFDLPTDVSAFWLVVREHPEGGLFLLVPTDDTPTVGGCDVPVPSFIGPPYATQYARCGLSVWCDPADLIRHAPRRAGAVSPGDLGHVRRFLHDMVRGLVPTSTPDDDDAEYLDLSGELERLGLILSGGKL